MRSDPQSENNRPPDRGPRVALGGLLALSAVLSFWLAFSGFVFYPVGDDWSVISNVEWWLQQKIFLTEAISPQGAHWSPLWFLVNGAAYAISDYRFGMVAVGIFKWGGVILWLSALMWLLRRAGLPTTAVAISAVLLLFHQSQVGILGQWKGIGAIFGNALGFTAIAMICAGILAGQRTFRGGVVAALILLIAHLFKETTLAYTLFLVAVIFLNKLLDSREERRGTWKLVLPSVLMSIAFVVVRYEIGTPSTLADFPGAATATRYQIGGLGDWVRNQAYLLLATSTPISIPLWFTASRAGTALFLFLTLVLNVALGVGLVHVERRREIRLLLGWSMIGIVTGGFPVILMRHVSEAYASSLIIWYCVLVAIAWCGFQRRGWRTYAASVLGLLFALHLASFVHKAARMAAAGRTEVAAMESGLNLLRKLSPHSAVCLEVSPQFMKGYSFYDPHPEEAILYGLVRSRLPVRVVDSRADAEYLLEIRAGGRVDLIHR